MICANCGDPSRGYFCSEACEEEYVADLEDELEADAG